MPETCPECGAAVPAGGSCRDHFHAMLLLEGEIPGVAGSISTSTPWRSTAFSIRTA
jgi:hypothetical protein